MNTSIATFPLTDPTIPLLRRTALWPNESLASVLERLTQLNFYPNSSWLQTIGRERLATLNIEDDLAQPIHLETFQQLACLTGLTLDELYAASDQHFANGPVPLGQTSKQMGWLENTTRPSLEPHWARDHLRPSVSTQFCPRCLKAAAYQRLSWIPRAAAICLEHRCLLRDRCSRCWARPTVADLVKRRCPTCQADLGRMRIVSIAHDSLGIRSQQLIQTWFNVADIPREVIEACHLPLQPPHVLYRLLHLLTRTLLHDQDEWADLPYPLNGLANPIAAAIDARHRLTPEQAYFLYRSAFAGLLDWPEGLHRMLDAYGGYDATSGHSPTRPKCLQHVQREWLTTDWHASPLAFVQPELLEYVLKRDLALAPSGLNQLKEIPWFIERTGLWTEEHTAQFLDLSLADLRRFCPEGSLADCYWLDSPVHAPRFKQAAVLAVQRRWATGWSLNDVSCWLGLETADVLRLVELSLLPMNGERNEDDDQGLFDRHAVKDFFAQIVARLEPYPGSYRNLSPLIVAVSEVRDLGVDTAILLQSVLAGLLPAYQREAEIEALYRIYFMPSTVYGLPDRLYAAHGWVSGDLFAYEYGFAPYLVRDWLAAGFIKPTASFGRHHYFDQQQLKELAAEHGFVSPIARPARKRRT